MSASDTRVYIRDEIAAPRPAPIRSVGLIGFARTHLFNSPGNILLTFVSAAVFVLLFVPFIRFVLIDAVWQGSDRTACLAETVGRPVGACWPFIQAKFMQFIYGFYPEAERWRVNIVFLLAAVLLIPLLIPRAPAKSLNAGLFFLAFPVVAFFLLHGGGLNGFAMTWIWGLIDSLLASLDQAGERLVSAGSAMAWLGEAILFLAWCLRWIAEPFAFARDLISASRSPVWTDFVLTALVTCLIVLFASKGNRWLAALTCVAIFAGMAVVIAALGLHDRGLPVVGTRQWGGLLITLVVSVTGIVCSMPIGIALALGRRSTIPLIKVFCVVFIEFWRGVPLITVLFFATYMLPLFLPGNFTVDGLLRVLIGVSLFAGAYNAEVVRGGLQAVPKGQTEAAQALGLSYWATTRLIVLPQALRHVIPGLVNSFIALFKDTTLVLIVAIFDLLGQLRAAFADPNWATPTTLFTGFAFTGIVYFVFCFGMSRYSLFVEHRLNAHRRR